MKRVAAIVLASGAVVALLSGCVESAPCQQPGQTPAGNTGPITGEVYVDTGSPYEPGALTVRTVAVARCEQGAPVDLLIHAPAQAGTYCVVVFQHGFLARNSDYSETLRHLASHGFVVVVPQMYTPGIGVLLGSPTAAVEAEWAAVVLAWLPDHLSALSGVEADTRRLGLAGHSRGGKVAWLTLAADSSRARAVAGVDPVGGTGGPGGNQARVVQGPFNFAFPSLVIGTGLGGACAPAGDNHVQFYDASAVPAWHVVAVDQGHGDMLDEAAAEAASRVCASGPDRAGMRRLTAGLLTAFFRGSLQGDESAFAWLTDVAAAPISVVIERK